MKYTHFMSNHRKTSKSAHVIVEGRNMGHASELPSFMLAISSIEKAEVKKLLRMVRACLDNL